VTDDASIVHCDGPCGDPIQKHRSVDVVAGDAIGEYRGSEPHIGVTGIDGPLPVHDTYCRDCARYEFGIDDVAGSRTITRPRRWLTPYTIGAFVLGVSLTLLLSAMFMV